MPRPRKDYALAAKKLANNEPIVHALTAAGFAPKQARKGRIAIENSGPLLRAMAKEGLKYADLAKNVGLKEAGNIATGRLISNCITGKDGGAMSAKILGSHRELNLFTPDTQVGLIVLNAPESAMMRRDELLKDCTTLPDAAPAGLGSVYVSSESKPTSQSETAQ